MKALQKLLHFSFIIFSQIQRIQKEYSFWSWYNYMNVKLILYCSIMHQNSKIQLHLLNWILCEQDGTANCLYHGTLPSLWIRYYFRLALYYFFIVGYCAKTERRDAWYCDSGFCVGVYGPHGGSGQHVPLRPSSSLWSAKHRRPDHLDQWN